MTGPPFSLPKKTIADMPKTGLIRLSNIEIPNGIEKDIVASKSKRFVSNDVILLFIRIENGTSVY